MSLLSHSIIDDINVDGVDIGNCAPVSWEEILHEEAVRFEA
jgi:hypothetical protein